MGVRRVSESETEYKFHLCSNFPLELVKRDVRLVGIVNDISTDSRKANVHLSCDTCMQVDTNRHKLYSEMSVMLSIWKSKQFTEVYLYASSVSRITRVYRF